MSIFYYAFLLAVVVTMFLSLVKPGVAMALAICLWSIKQGLMAKIPIFANYSPLANFIFAGLVGITWLRVSIRKKEIPQYPPGMFTLCGLFFAMLLTSVLWAPERVYTISGWIEAAPYVILFILFFPGLLTKESDLPVFFRAYVWLGFFMVLAFLFSVEWQGRGIAFEAGGMAWDPDYGMFRFRNGDPLETAAFAMRLIIVLVFVNVQSKALLFSAFRWLLIILSTLLLLKTGTRANVLVLAPTLLFFFPVARRIKDVRSFITSTIAILCLAGVGYYIVLYAANDGRWAAGIVDADAQIRGDIFRASMDAWLHNGAFRFLFGFGYNSSFNPIFGIAFPEVGPAALAMDLGFVGLVLWVFIGGYAVASWFRLYRRTANDPVARGYVAILGAFPFSEFFLNLKGSGYWPIVAWAILIARYEMVWSHENPAPEAPMLLTGHRDLAYAPAL